jgi:cyanate permease
MKTLINQFGWQQACWLLAAVIGGGMSVIGVLFLRDTPEECGLLMDGKTPTDFDDKAKPDLHPVHRQFTRAQAAGTISFWAFALGLAAHGLIVTAVAFHITSIGQEMGKTTDQAVKMFLYSSFLSIPTRFIVSYFVDNTRLPLRWMLSLMAVTMGLYTFGLTVLDTRSGWLLTTVMFGMTGGIWGVLCNVPLPRYFGRDHLGAISGLMMSILVIASALGPAMFSYGKQRLGSYHATAYVMLVLPAIILVLSLLIRNPQRKYAP